MQKEKNIHHNTMKLYCSSCGILVAEILNGSNIRKGASMICKECLERYKIADDMAKLARKQSKCLNNDIPDFIKDLFEKGNFK